MEPLPTEALIDHLGSYPLSIGHEKQAQMDLEHHLTTTGIPFKREVVLSDRDTPDFVIDTADGPVVVEMKIRAQRKRIYKQLERYASHEHIVGIILVTATPMSLPEHMYGKPTHVISMGRGWL